MLLLHGFPASSFMFRHLIPLLADPYCVIGPNYLGFGLSDAPAAGEFGYTFDALAGLTAGLLDQLRADQYVLYAQDYGAPVGWRRVTLLPGRHQARRAGTAGLLVTHHRPGFYMRVITDGHIQDGDAIAKTRTRPGALSVAAPMRCSTIPGEKVRCVARAKLWAALARPGLNRLTYPRAAPMQCPSNNMKSRNDSGWNGRMESPTMAPCREAPAGFAPKGN